MEKTAQRFEGVKQTIRIVQQFQYIFNAANMIVVPMRYNYITNCSLLIT